MSSELEFWLREDGQLETGPAIFTPLGGGVSCDIHKVQQNGHSFVVKRALPQLRVAEEWRADVSRNAVEARFYKEMAELLPRSLPGMLFHNPDRSYFTMEYLGQGWTNWKTVLLKGDAETQNGVEAGLLMGKLHRSSWGNSHFAEVFDTMKNFRQLRTDPYLRVTAERMPEVQNTILNEANRLESTRLCLVHGDFSPKNLLVKRDRMILLDAEVACFGDPAFDIAFFTSHLLLKALHFAPNSLPYLQVAQSAWSAYCSVLKELATLELESRSIRLLGILILARIYGKSPVEYLNKQQVLHVRALGIKLLTEVPSDFRSLWQACGTFYKS